MTIEGRRACRTLARDARGANYVEYVVLVGIVALVALGGARIFGGSLRGKVATEAGCVAALDCAPSGGPSARAAMAAAAGTGASTGDRFGSSASAITAGSTSAPEPRSVGTRAVDFGKGVVVDGVWGSVTGLISAGLHPVSTLEGIGTAIAHPLNTASAVKDNIVARWHANPERLAGAATFEVATLGLVVGKAAKAVGIARDVGSAAQATETAEAAAKTVEAAKVADAAAEAGDAAKAAKTAARSEALAQIAARQAPDTLAAAREAKQALDGTLAQLSNEQLEARVQQVMDLQNGSPAGYLPGCTDTWNAHTVTELKSDWAATGLGSKLQNWSANLDNAQGLRMQLMNTLDKTGRAAPPDMLPKWWQKELEAAPVHEFYERLKTGRMHP